MRIKRVHSQQGMDMEWGCSSESPLAVAHPWASACSAPPGVLICEPLGWTEAQGSQNIRAPRNHLLSAVRVMLDLREGRGGGGGRPMRALKQQAPLAPYKGRGRFLAQEWAYLYLPSGGAGSFPGTLMSPQATGES